MRVWEKNFIVTLTLFVAVLFLFVFIVVTASFKTALDAKRESAMHEEHFIAMAIASDIAALENRNVASAQTITAVVTPYGDYYQRRGIYMALANKEGVLFNNAPIDTSAISSFQNEKVCDILRIGDDKYVRITDALQETTDEYALVYMSSINRTYEAQYKQTTFLVITSVGVAVLLAFGLFFTLKRIYRPIDNLAHELRTPLTAIRDYAEYLKLAAASEEERYSAANYIIEESKRLSDISNKLLIMANLREGDFEYAKIEIKSLFETAKMTFENVEYDIKQQYIKGDKALLQSMINNLVANAERASESNQTIYLKAHNNMIEVIDFGKGMSEQQLTSASKPYYRAKVNKDNHGAGLGIPLCYQIARLHNADIRFISKEGEGTTVRITFTKP